MNPYAGLVPPEPVLPEIAADPPRFAAIRCSSDLESSNFNGLSLIPIWAARRVRGGVVHRSAGGRMLALPPRLLL